MASQKKQKRKAAELDEQPVLEDESSLKPHKKRREAKRPASGEQTAAAHDGKGRKRKRKAKPDVEMTPEEQQRRQKQRDLRNMAIKMRSEGMPYKRPPQKKRKLEVKTSIHSNGRGFQDHIETGSRPTEAVQVILVPIFWNRKPEEKEQVIAAAEKIAEMLKESGIDCGIDTTNAMSPGQKYAYWEGQGVKVRVECGPSDVSRRTCVLALSKKAGELAEKQTFQVGQKLVSAIASNLGMEVKDFGIEAAGKSSKREDVIEPKVGHKRAALTSGDDLGGDYEELGVNDAAGEGRRKQKKKKGF